MRFARLRYGTMTLFGRIHGDAAIPLVLDNGEPWFDPLRAWLAGGRRPLNGEIMSFASADILAPLRSPSKIVAVGLNYHAHAAEQGKPVPTVPMLFAKAPSAIVGPGTSITCRRADAAALDYETELAVVIGTTARNVTVDRALEHVFGYTICNDVTARDAQRIDGQFFRAKSFDTFCPLGPYLVDTDEISDPGALRITTRVNGEIRQESTTADMIHSVAEVIAYASRFFTLEAGDIITTGTPAGVGSGFDPPRFLQDGDVVESEIEGIGVLRNTVELLDE